MNVWTNWLLIVFWSFVLTYGIIKGLHKFVKYRKQKKALPKYMVHAVSDKMGLMSVAREEMTQLAYFESEPFVEPIEAYKRYLYPDVTTAVWFDKNTIPVSAESPNISDSLKEVYRCLSASAVFWQRSIHPYHFLLDERAIRIYWWMVSQARPVKVEQHELMGESQEELSPEKLDFYCKLVETMYVQLSSGIYNTPRVQLDLYPLFASFKQIFSSHNNLKPEDLSDDVTKSIITASAAYYVFTVPESYINKGPLANLIFKACLFPDFREDHKNRLSKKVSLKIVK